MSHGLLDVIFTDDRCMSRVTWGGSDVMWMTNPLSKPELEAVADGHQLVETGGD